MNLVEEYIYELKRDRHCPTWDDVRTVAWQLDHQKLFQTIDLVRKKREADEVDDATRFLVQRDKDKPLFEIVAEFRAREERNSDEEWSYHAAATIARALKGMSPQLVESTLQIAHKNLERGTFDDDD